MDWSVAGPYVTGVMAAAVAVLVAKMQNRGRPENAMIDQLQEQIKDDREAKDKEMAVMRGDITGLKAEQSKAKRREHIRDNYINALRDHINAGNPPPPPVWPEGLYD